MYFYGYHTYSNINAVGEYGSIYSTIFAFGEF